MQHSPFEIKTRLLRAVDREYNVVDMGTVLEIVTILERTPITKEALETTRLGRDINELRRKTTNESLAKRAKDLVRRWRDLILPQAEGGGGCSAPSLQSATTTDVAAQNGAVTTVAVASPSVGASGTVSTAAASKRGGYVSTVASTLPAAIAAIPAMGAGTAGSGTGGAASAYRSHSISPTASLPASDRSLPVSPALSSSRSMDAVPRTHASNMRLRKGRQSSSLSASPEPSPAKKPKLEPAPLPVQPSLDELVPITRQNGDHYEAEDIGSDVEIVSVTPAATPTKLKKGKKAPKDRTKKKKKDRGGNRDIVKEKIASIARLHKVKTTQELLAGLNQGPGSENCVLPLEDVNKSEHIVKFLKSQSENDEDALVDVEGRSDAEEVKPAVKTAVKIKKSKNKSKSSATGAAGGTPAQNSTWATPEEILARLPPLDLASIDWSADDTPECDAISLKPTGGVTDADVDRILNEHVEGLNGNYEQLEPEGERVFREWHEVFTTTSNEAPLHILPYVVID